MLEFIRSHTQSLGVKLAFGLIIVVFVFWGVGSMQSMSTSSVVATVNGDPISMMTFERAFMQMEDAVRRNSPNITSTQLKEMQLVPQVLQQLVAASLLQQEAKRLGMTVSNLELGHAIAQIPVFQDSTGKFDPETYKNVLAAQRQSMSTFENAMRQQLLEEKLRKEISATGGLFSQEARAYFNFLYERRNVEYVFFAAEDYPQTTPAEDALKSYYESNRPRFTVPAKADVEYLTVYPADLVPIASIDANAVQDYYQKNSDAYAVPARSKVRHILVRLAPEGSPEATPEATQKATETMDAIVADMAKGEDFATLAQKYSQDEGTAPQGGDLGWVTEGNTVLAFNNAVFSMKVGDISDPVRSEFGLHLIKVEEAEAATIKPLSDIETDIRTLLAKEQGLEKIREVLDNLIEANVLGNSLTDAATAQGLTADAVQHSGLQSAEALSAMLRVDTKAASQLLEIPEGAPLDTVIETTDNGYIIARITQQSASTIQPYADVKAEIIQILNEQTALEAALQAAATVRKDMGENLPDSLISTVKLIEGAQRGSGLGILGIQPDITAALFSLPQEEWLPTAYPVVIANKPGAVLVRTKSIAVPKDSDWEPVAEFLSSTLANQRKEQMFQVYINALAQEAEVRILNEEYLNSRGAYE